MRATSRKLRVSKIFVTRVLLVLSALGVSAHECAKKPSDIELRITPGELVKGVPRTISFVFLNITDHEERIPPVSPSIFLQSLHKRQEKAQAAEQEVLTRRGFSNRQSLGEG